MESALKVLLLHKNQEEIDFLVSLFQEESSLNCVIVSCSEINQAISDLQKSSFDLVFSHDKLLDFSSLKNQEKIEYFYQLAEKVPVITSSGICDSQLALEGLRMGSYKFTYKNVMDRQSLKEFVYSVFFQQDHFTDGTVSFPTEFLWKTHFPAFLNLSADALFILDQEGHIRFSNKSGVEMFQEPPQELIGKKINDSIALGNSKIEIIRKEHAPIIAEMQVIEIEWQNTTAYLATLRDVTAQTYQVEELIKASKFEAFEVATSGITHDLNNILMAINLNLEVALNQVPETSPIRIMLDQANQQSKKAKQLSHRLTSFSKSHETEIEEVDLGLLISDCIKNLSKKSHFKIQTALKHKSELVAVDILQFQQVIENIITNAKEACDENGELYIKSKFTKIGGGQVPNLEPGNYVKIEFHDNGPGVEQKHLSKIFDPYYTTKKKRRGLGLTSCYSIVKRHKGAIIAKSKVEKGCVFVVYIPSVKKAEKPKETNGFSEKTLENAKLLIVEDNEVICHSLHLALETIGFEVEYAYDGKEGVQQYEEHFRKGKPFDAVLLDGVIPEGVGGDEALELLKKVDPKVKAILLSGYNEKSLLNDWKKCGFLDRLMKPCSVEEVIESLKKVC